MYDGTGRPVLITGVFVGEGSPPGLPGLWAVFYGDGSEEYLARRLDDGKWSIVAVKDRDGAEFTTAMTECPDPLVIMSRILNRDQEYDNLQWLLPEQPEGEDE